MRVELENGGKKKRKESSLPLLAAIGALFGLGYLASTPSVAAMLPMPIERALTSMRKEVDTLAGTAMVSVNATYANVAGLIGR